MIRCAAQQRGSWELDTHSRRLFPCLLCSRCKLCDLLRAEAWGLGHRDWQERRCGQCWKEYANTLAQQRHEASPARPQRLNAPTAAAPAAGGSHLDMHGAGVVSDLLLPLLGQAVAEGRVDLEDVLAAARARDGERLAELMDHRCAVAPHPGCSLSYSQLAYY